MNNITLKKIISGAILFLGIYYLLSVVPKNKLEERDVLIITLVLFVAYLLYDNILAIKSEGLDASTSYNEKSENVSLLPPTMSMEQNMPEPIKISDTQGLPSVEECTTCKVDMKDNNEVKKISNEDGNLAHSYQPIRKYPNVGSRMDNGIMTNEMSYTDYNTIPIGSNIDSKVDDFSYTFLPPDRWYPVPPHPPICIAEKQCPICPILTTGTQANLKEWGETSRVTPGDQVNTTYLNEKLNSGR